jgi:hypothetical protein
LAPEVSGRAVDEHVAVLDGAALGAASEVTHHTGDASAASPVASRRFEGRATGHHVDQTVRSGSILLKKSEVALGLFH